MAVEPFICELDPEAQVTMKLFLFKNVQNTEEIRSNVIKGTWKCSVIKPSVILHPFQVAVAANRAVVAQKSNSMVTKNIFAEILFNLSISKNITQSLSKFGVEKEKDLLVCTLTTAGSDDSEIISQIKGEICHISQLDSLTDIKALKSVYKLNNIKNDEDLLDVIVSRMVTKSFVSH